MTERAAKRRRLSSTKSIHFTAGCSPTSEAQKAPQLSTAEYTVGWICALPSELTAALAMLDSTHGSLQIQPEHDSNTYNLGSIGDHHVAIACLPSGGTINAALAAKSMQATFPNLRFDLMVGIGGGVPSTTNDIRLGDVVVSLPSELGGGVIQYDLGKREIDGFRRVGSLNKPPTLLRTAITNLRAMRSLAREVSDLVNNAFAGGEDADDDDREWTYPLMLKDNLFRADYPHANKNSTCDACAQGLSEGAIVERRQRKSTHPRIHYGNIASGNTVMKNAIERDELAERDNVICFEMEAAGLMDDFPCLVIRGISDYADSHKHDSWQPYASAVAAAFAKQLLRTITPQAVESLEPLNDIFGKVAKNVSIVLNSVKSLTERAEGSDQQAILDWVSPVDYSEQQFDFSSIRHQESGQWFIDSEAFRRWADTCGNTILCPGMPGVGKTIITSIVIDYLHQKFQSPSSIGIAFIYCTFREHKRLAELLSSLLTQLVRRRTSMPEALSDCYYKHLQSRSRPSTKEITTQLHSTITEFSRTFILIDALDELHIPYGERQQFLSVLLNFQTQYKINIFATSRFVEDLLGAFNEVPIVEIRAHDQDVRDYLRDKVSRFRLFDSKPNPPLQEQIQNEIAQLANGMFLLAKLYIESLEHKLNIQEVKLALADLRARSVGLESDKTRAYDQAYERTMERINAQEFQNIAKQVLMWVTCSRWPLTAVELQHALSVKIGQSDLNEESLTDPEFIISTCAGLITIDKQSQVVRLVHYTAQEYFERCRNKWFPTAEDDISGTCVTYLSYNIFKAAIRESNEDLEELEDRFRSCHKLYDYAVNNWLHHACCASSEADLVILNFLTSDSRLFAIIAPVRSSNDSTLQQYWLRGRGGIRNLPPLHIAAMVGLERIVKLLLRQNRDPTSKDSGYRTPLWWAAWKGSEVITRLLIEGGSNVDVESHDENAPLLTASRQDHHAVARFLVEKGAKLNVKDNDGLTPLSYALKNGDETLVKLLLERGADRVADDEKQTPLALAAANGDEYTTRLLLKLGADANKGNPTPLYIATGIGHETILQLLINHGARIDPDDNGEIPLCLAASCGHSAVVRLLLHRGARVDPRNNLDQTPLMLAAANGHEAVVSLLLRDGASVNAQDGNKDTPLLLAAASGHEMTVKLLLMNQANVNEQNCKKESPLSKAIRIKNHTVARLLLEKGADANLKCRDESTPLYEAVKTGNECLTRILLEHGVDVNIRGYFGWTPLFCAVSQSDEAIVRLLLNNGADIQARDAKNFTPLFYAIRKKDESMVGLLLENGAGINTLNKLRSDPLSYAVRYGNESMVRFLLENGADLKTSDKRGSNPLPYAVEHGNESMVRFLLENGADVNTSNKRSLNPLPYAAEKGNESMASLLLENGADVNTSDIRGLTPLLYAVRGGNESMVRFLLKNGADVDIADARGRTPLSYALDQGAESMARLLREHGAKEPSVDDDANDPEHEKNSDQS